MPAWILEKKITMTITDAEAEAMWRALGNLSEKHWKAAGTDEADMAVMIDLYRCLDQARTK